MVIYRNKLYFLLLFLVGYLGLFLLINIHPVMAMDGYNPNDPHSIKNEILKISSKREKISKKILHFNKLNLNPYNLIRQSKDLDQNMTDLYKRIANLNALNCINQKIWQYSYERNQIAIKILSLSGLYQGTTMIEELNKKHQEIIQKIQNLNQKYFHLQNELNANL
ncbi:MAG: SVM family protein [Candidatus Phytoplasma australasiaticum]|nr:SVM family protein [Candidatus Phytoplasma australasiaticum]MDV3153846.1 SVM family protein [Candidatus Phytoplasma australasiaticum]MDV3167701.1 SVM family protein [Candidatus Phytoplasma australasiaticum]MDV3181093.1 SVM family protein [Candidatus Phytoplasma australasiaticum]MDV3183330.1 SVM family protein [Candidatus Phytoplasma australasiaticum]